MITNTHTPPDEETNPPNRSIRSYVLRQGHLSAAQKRAVDTLLPTFGCPYQAQPLNTDQLFERPAPTILEIGFGMGTTTADIAANHPHLNYLGVEVHTPGVGSLLQHIQQRALTNIRIIQHDAVAVLENMIAPNSLAGIHLFFPDPWPKKRHHKRRIIQPAFTQLLASRLQPQGYLHCATDWLPYAEHMLAIISAEPTLYNPHLDNHGTGYAPRPAPIDRPLTKFEQRGLKLGHDIRDIIVIRT